MSPFLFHIQLNWPQKKGPFVGLIPRFKNCSTVLAPTAFIIKQIKMDPVMYQEKYNEY
jgi:hypothetical protein